MVNLELILMGSDAVFEKNANEKGKIISVLKECKTKEKNKEKT